MHVIHLHVWATSARALAVRQRAVLLIFLDFLICRLAISPL